MRQYALFRNRKLVLHAGINIQEGSALHIGCLKFAELIGKKSNHTMTLSTHTITLSGNNHHLLEILKEGSLDFAFCEIDSLNEDTNHRISILSMPFLFESIEQAYAILNGALGQEMFEDLETSGLMGLHYWTMGWRHISTRSQPVHLPSDLKGMKIRIMHKRVINDFFKLLGAQPIKMHYNDVLSAIKQGLVDSQENPHKNFLSMKFYKAQSYISDINLYLDLEAMLTTQATWNKLSGWQKKVVLEAAEEATLWLWNECQNINQNSLETLQKQHGIKVSTSTKQELEIWRKSADPLYKRCEFPEIISKILKAKEKYYEEKLH
jgi:tripartite ATP-independent transporter DctP family solute receptor